MTTFESLSAGIYLILFVSSIPTVVLGLSLFHSIRAPLPLHTHRACVWWITTSTLSGLFGVSGLVGQSGHVGWMGGVCALSAIYASYLSIHAILTEGPTELKSR